MQAPNPPSGQDAAGSEGTAGFARPLAHRVAGQSETMSHEMVGYGRTQVSLLDTGHANEKWIHYHRDDGRAHGDSHPLRDRPA